MGITRLGVAGPAAAYGAFEAKEAEAEGDVVTTAPAYIRQAATTSPACCRRTATTSPVER